ncbi:uncharacterized protein M421DRAFT_424673 [Didymella exigua CBS 183.55]|uniref:Uncharacterized protein n=1 Tax=Didymella exigua CBS 183.55 TaxID=1150837 RepID=A0A6A5RFW7_9PLEO|nr:uncharacterized protein M421DRAFT_424673 [Didymella exigua CBS 183.55]KAF1924537.1 hypothetical protein M421DRAFT_424673 [Didymella exigua CBS 183.55]
MAAFASSRQTPPVQQLTPPSSSHGAAASWEFAVPLDGSRQSYDQEAFMAGNSANGYKPHTSHNNGFAKPVRSTTWESQGQYDDGRVTQASGRASSLHKKPSRDVITSEQDGAYGKGSTKGKMGPPASVRGRGAKKSATGSPTDLEADQSNWIHRDKLKEIEIREMEEAGFRIGRTSRSNSRSQSATRRTRTNSELGEGRQSGDDRYERRVVSPIPAEDEEALHEQRYHTWSPTNSDDPAPEMQPPSRTNHTVRPSTSRIPLPKTSGIPVPAAVADREAPLPRSRTGSANWNGDIAAAGARVRSGSIGSQVLLDDYTDEKRYGHRRDNSSSASASSMKQPPRSPVKAKTPGKLAATAGSRKTSTTSRNTAKSRQVSGNKRPGTSGNAVSRPTTAHRPEGEAPWIATMYKPDPRLPPDQQIIPTHAKRMQQEQWETEGRVGSMYDTDFRLLNAEEMGGQRLSQIDPIALEKERESGQWPLASSDKQASGLDEKLEPMGDRSPAVEQPQFKLTPTIPQSPRVPSPKPGSIKRAASEKPTTTRVPEAGEEIPEKKGKCCIVM